MIQINRGLPYLRRNAQSYSTEELNKIIVKSLTPKARQKYFGRQQRQPCQYDCHFGPHVDHWRKVSINAQDGSIGTTTKERSQGTKIETVNRKTKENQTMENQTMESQRGVKILVESTTVNMTGAIAPTTRIRDLKVKATRKRRRVRKRTYIPPRGPTQQPRKL